MLRLEDFPNLLPQIRLTAAQVERQIANYPLEFLNKKDRRAEWESRFPLFVPAFYAHVVAKHLVPTQPAYWQSYLGRNGQFFKSQAIDKALLTSLKARVYRTYPSLVRDLHFALYLREKAQNAAVIYNADLDAAAGIDLLIQWRQKLFGINLFTSTERAHFARAKKAGRHVAYENVTPIELPLDFRVSQQCGRFFLYGRREFEQLLAKMKAAL